MDTDEWYTGKITSISGAIHLCPACMEGYLEMRNWTTLTPYAWWCPKCGTAWPVEDLIEVLNQGA